MLSKTVYVLKLIGLIFIVLFATTSLSQDSSKQMKFTSINCLAVNGLNLRNYPSQDSLAIHNVPYSKELHVISRTGEKERIAGFKGEWLKVRYENSIGYVFSSYTSHYSAPQLREQGYSYLFDYLSKNYRLVEGNTSFDIDKSDMDLYDESFVFDNIPYNFNNKGHDAIETIVISGAEIEECFIVFSASVWVFRQHSFEPSSFKRIKNENGETEYRSYKLKDPENSSEGYIYSYQLDDSGEYVSMGIDFEWEAGGSWFKCEKQSDNSVRIRHGYYSH